MCVSLKNYTPIIQIGNYYGKKENTLKNNFKQDKREILRTRWGDS